MSQHEDLHLPAVENLQKGYPQLHPPHTSMNTCTAYCSRIPIYDKRIAV